MKLFLTLIITMLSAFFCVSEKKGADLSKSIPAVDSMNQTEDTNLSLSKGKKDSIEYEFSVKFVKGGTTVNSTYIETDAIVVEYTLKNSGKSNYLLFNQGHTNPSLKKGVVYVEPKSDGTIELSQKRFSFPNDKNCPKWDVPIEAGAIWLKAKQTVKETVIIELPLKLFTPFDACLPQPEMPKEMKGLKFCLGIAEANAKKVKVDAKGFVTGWEYTKPQLLLCGDVFKFS
jgi:hypothetical protein